MKEVIIKKLALIALFLGVILGLFAAYFYVLNPTKVPVVIDFTGKTAQEVMSWVDKEKLKSNQYKYEYKYSDDIGKDIVIEQNLTEGELYEEQTLIFTISKGSNPSLEIEVPDFVKMTKSEIEEFFKENKFSDYTFEYSVSKTIAKDGFIKINKDTTTLKRDDVIVVTISIGKENIGLDIVMPDFEGASKSTVKTWCSENNITCKFTEEYSNTVKSGLIISQEPVAKTDLKTGGKATFNVSAGAGIELVDLTGKTKSEVETWAKNNNAKVQFIEYYSDSTTKGTVISTTPKSGNITASTVIKVYISLGSVTMENFVGKEEADLKTWLSVVNGSIYDSANHISYKVVTDNTSKKEEGSIISTSPASGKTVKFKTVITVTVAGANYVTVSSKADITINELKSYLEGLKLSLGVKQSEVYSPVEAGKVVRNEYGSVREGTAINYTTSLGPYSPISSDFNGKTSDAASNILKTANNKEAGGWSLGTTETYSDTVTKGLLYDCEINVGNKEVRCKVSLGAKPKSYTIGNDYVGKSKLSFINYLSECGLLGASSEEYSDTVGSGYIISINGGTYTTGDTVKFVVSLGQDPANKKISVNEAKIAVLNAYPKDGLSVDTTKAYISGLLNEWGFTNYSFVEVGNDEPAGTLLEHNLAVGDLAPNASITIKISKGVN